MRIILNGARIWNIVVYLCGGSGDQELEEFGLLIFSLVVSNNKNKNENVKLETNNLKLKPYKYGDAPFVIINYADCDGVRQKQTARA